MHWNDYVITSECLPTTTLSLTTTKTITNFTTMTDNFNSINQHIVHAGYLIKSPPENRIWKTKWRRRWFVLKLSGQIPGQYVLEYYTDATCKKLKGQIDLDQCEQVDAGLQLEIQQKNYDNMFDLRTTKRTYYLVASCEDEMNRWVECICSVCGLKIEAIQNELALLPQLEMHNNNNNSNFEQEQRYSPQPSQNEQLQSSPSSSQQQSTSESSLSTLNYIPISECYSGKPNNNKNKNQPPLPLSSSPPPRPPKPPTLQFSKSQSSLALWPQDSQPQQKHLQNSPTTKSQQSIFLSQSSTINPNNNNLPPKSCIPSNLVIYNNGTNNKPSYLDSCKSKNTPYNVYDTWHSRSRPDFLSPPQVNRDLKPQRRIILEQQPQNINKINNQKNINNDGQIVMNPLSKQQFKKINNQSQPILSNTNRHTLPRPLIQRYSLRNIQNKTNNNDDNSINDNYCHLAHCEQPKTIEDCERQYLDLDLDSDTNNNNTSNSNSPKALNNDNNYNASTVATTLLPTSSSVNPNNIITTSTTIVPNDLVNSSQTHSNRNNNLNHIPNLLNNNENSNLNTNTVGLAESDNCGTVYKKVDFLKTKAFNIMRVNVVSNRNPNQ